MLAPEQVDAYRRTFRILNKFMVRMWKMGMGRMINLWPAVGGRIMVIKHTGRNSGRTLYAPVNYAEVDGQIYCTAGFGAMTDWYRNLMKNPCVELWLPDRRVQMKAKDISDSEQRLHLLREVLIASGFAARLFGIDAKKISDGELDRLTSDYRLIQFIGETNA
jgi:deazaflavin-dependent oxidoreductase (nitroreductase family)